MLPDVDTTPTRLATAGAAEEPPRGARSAATRLAAPGAEEAACDARTVPARLSRGWVAGACALVIGALGLAAGGFVNSFAAVRDAVAPSFGGLAWTVPVLIDLGVAVFSGIDLLFTRLGIRLWWLRFVPWTLIGATIWLNVAHETTSVGVVAHAAPPVLWVVTVELAAHAMRSRAGLEPEHPGRRRPTGRMDKVRAARWLLAPWSTLVIRRWMILQEERSYERANHRWWARKQAKWELQDTYGTILWRIRAPRRARGLYRWGHLSLETTASPANDGCTEGGIAPRILARAPGRDVTPAAGNTRAGPAPQVPARRRAAPAAFEDFEVAAAELRAEGQPVNRTLVTRRLRDRGMSLANYRADQYLARLNRQGTAA